MDLLTWQMRESAELWLILQESCFFYSSDLILRVPKSFMFARSRAGLAFPCDSRIGLLWSTKLLPLKYGLRPRCLPKQGPMLTRFEQMTAVRFATRFTKAVLEIVHTSRCVQDFKDDRVGRGILFTFVITPRITIEKRIFGLIFS